ncbi:MAG: hypothetical protein MK052_08375 [Alphaproteobacteria bacterium]|nr:hypothetical protein [Alphaproteobacteria bacterium]
MNKGVMILLVLVAIGAIAFVASTFDADVKGGSLPSASVDVTQTEDGSIPKYEIRKTQEGNMPKYDVDGDVYGGEMPEVDIDAPDVDVKTETREIEVPTGIEVDSAEDQ